MIYLKFSVILRYFILNGQQPPLCVLHGFALTDISCCAPQNLASVSSHSLLPSAQPDITSPRIRTLSAPSEEVDEPVETAATKQRSRSVDEADYRGNDDDPPSTPDNRPSTRSRRAKKAKNTADTKNQTGQQLLNLIKTDLNEECSKLFVRRNFF